MPLRTLNVTRDIDGIATDVMVNVAYNPAPGITYAQTQELEWKLQMEIQRILQELSGKPLSNLPPDSPAAPQYIPLTEARRISGHATTKAFDHWAIRHNNRHPNDQILRRPGYVEINSLQHALKVAAETPHHKVVRIIPINPKKGDTHADHAR